MSTHKPAYDETRQECQICNGTGLVPQPRGMSPGFYKFMGAGCRQPDGTLRMLCVCRNKSTTHETLPGEAGAVKGDVI
jgi:hypothetical protein